MRALRGLLALLPVCCRAGLRRSSAAVETAGPATVAVTVDSDGHISLGWGATTLPLGREAIGFREAGQWLRPGKGLRLESAGRPLLSWGTDNLGRFSVTQVTWRAEGSGRRFQTNVRAYESVPAVALQQVLLDGTDGAAFSDDDLVVTAFPALSINEASLKGLGFVTFAHNMACPNGTLPCTYSGELGTEAATKTILGIHGQEGLMPLVLFDAQRTLTAVLSPMNNFMTTNVWLDEPAGALLYGVQGKVDVIPPGFSHDTFVWFSAGGVNEAMEGWGAALRRFYQAEHAVHDDLTVQYLSYYTDNGAYYYYLTEPGKTYEQTIVDVWEYSRARGIPYRALQLDSWWYFKGRDQGVLRWDARPEVFPSGLKGLQERLGGNVPIVAHNRWWSVESSYARQHGGGYDFAIEPRKPLPLHEAAPSSANRTKLTHRRLKFYNPMAPLPYGAAVPLEQRFWDDLFADAKGWGLYTYEQDWLHNEFLTLNYTLATLDGARRWLLQMGRAAHEAGLRIQYCMGYPRFYLQSLEIPAVTQIRVSDDYGPSSRPDQWAIGDTAILAHAMGLAPFKDAFWSGFEQPGNPYNGSIEAKPALEAAISTLSAGPVGPGDRMGSEDRELILRSCNADGLLLKPSRPLASIDASFMRRAFGSRARGPEGAVYATHALVGGLRFDVVLGAALNSSFELLPEDLRLPPPSSDARLLAYSPPPYRGREVNATDVRLQWFGRSQGQGLRLGPCGRQDFQLWYTSPVLDSGVVLLGELAKWVPVSPQRVLAVQSVAAEAGGGRGRTTVQLTGAVGEAVELFFADPKDLEARPVVVKCVMGGNGLATATVEVEAWSGAGIVKAECA